MAALSLFALVGAAQAAPDGKITYDALPGPENGLLTVSPDRWQEDVTPGRTTTFELKLLNLTGADSTITLTPTDVAPGEGEGTGTVEAVEQFRFGAGEWVQPEQKVFKLKNLERAIVEVDVTPPTNAPVGSSLGGLLVQLKSENQGGSTEADAGGGAKVVVNIRALVQIYPRVPGEIEHGLRIATAEVADRVVFTGNRYVVYEIEVENTGNVNEPMTGDTLVRSMFGNTVETLDVRDMLVLRGSRRKVRMLWTKPPKFGRFGAEARIESQVGKDTKDFPKVTILPPWWWFVILAVVVITPPVILWYRRRRAWLAYLADEDWDDDWDEEADDEFRHA